MNVFQNIPLIVDLIARASICWPLSGCWRHFWLDLCGICNLHLIQEFWRSKSGLIFCVVNWRERTLFCVHTTPMSGVQQQLIAINCFLPSVLTVTCNPLIKIQIHFHLARIFGWKYLKTENAEYIVREECKNSTSVRQPPILTLLRSQYCTQD